ncbi:MAG: heme exporter protein CcmD [Roseiarcus sp.]
MIEAPHFGFVAAAYALAALVIFGMIAAVLGDYRAQTRALRRLEQAQRRRRGEP